MLGWYGGDSMILHISHICRVQLCKMSIMVNLVWPVLILVKIDSVYCPFCILQAFADILYFLFLCCWNSHLIWINTFLRALLPLWGVLFGYAICENWELRLAPISMICNIILWISYLIFLINWECWWYSLFSILNRCDVIFDNTV